MAEEILPLDQLIRDLQSSDQRTREMEWVTNTVSADEAERLGQTWDLYDAPVGVHTTFAQAGVPVVGAEWATVAATLQDMTRTGNLTGQSGPAGALLRPRTADIGDLTLINIPGRPTPLFGGFSGLTNEENADLAAFAREYVRQFPESREEDIYAAIDRRDVPIREVISSPRFGGTYGEPEARGLGDRLGETFLTGVGTVAGAVGSGASAVGGGLGWLGDRITPDPVGRFLRDNPVTDNVLEPVARGGRWATGRTVDNALEPTVNVGFRALNYPFEMTQGMVAQTIENVRNEGFLGAVDNTLRPDLLIRDLSEAQLTTQLGAFGQDVVEELGGPWAREDLRVGEGVDIGEGFFPTGENQEAFRLRAEEQFKPKIQGEGATLGRWMAQFLDPDSNWHQFVSGTVDGILAVKGPGERVMENAFRDAALGPARTLTQREYGARVIDHLALATTDDAIDELLPFADDTLRAAVREAGTASDVRAAVREWVDDVESTTTRSVGSSSALGSVDDIPEAEQVARFFHGASGGWVEVPVDDARVMSLAAEVMDDPPRARELFEEMGRINGQTTDEIAEDIAQVERLAEAQDLERLDSGIGYNIENIDPDALMTVLTHQPDSFLRQIMPEGFDYNDFEAVYGYETVTEAAGIAGRQLPSGGLSASDEAPRVIPTFDLDEWIPATGPGARATQAAYWLTNTHLTPTVDVEAVAKMTTAEAAVPYFERLASTTSARAIDNMTGNALSLERLAELADAKTAEAARLIIRDELGITMRRIPRGSGAGWDAIRDRAPTITRLAHQMPDGNFNVGDGRQFLTDIEDWLVNSNASSDTLDRWFDRAVRTVAPTDREDLIEGLMRETGIRAALGDTFDDAGTSIATGPGVSSMRPQLDEWVRINPDKNLDADELWKAAVAGNETGFGPLDDLVTAAGNYYGEMTRLWRNSIDEARVFDLDRTTGDLIDTFVANGEEVIKAKAEPQLLAEHLQHNIPMPDVRKMRAEFSRFRNILLQQARGELKPSTSFYYAALSAQSKVWKPSVLLRIAWPIRVIGEEQLRLAASGLPSAFTHPFQHMAVVLGTPGHGKIGAKVGRFTGDAMGESFIMSQQFTDGLSSRVDNFYTGVRGRAQRRYQGWEVLETGTTRNGVRTVNMAQWDRTAEAWADDLAKLRHDRVAGPVSRRTLDDAKEWFWNDQEELRQILRRSHPDAAVNPLTREGSDAYIDAVSRRIDDVTRGNADLVEAVRSGRIGDVSMSNTTSASINSAFIKKLGDYTDYVPEFLPARRSIPLGWTEGGGKWDRAVERMFGMLMGTPTDKLSRSPVFRQEYWNEVNVLAGRMDPQYTDELLAAAEAANIPRGQIRQIGAFAGAPGRGIPTGAVGQLSLEEIDALAKAHALDRTRTLLFDLSKRNQFFDINALLIPFGDAWGEVISRWAKLTKDNPQVIRRGMQAIQAGRDTGIVQKDQYGNEEFIYPFSEQIMQVAGFINPKDGLQPGVGVKLTGDLAGVSLMTNIFPGAGVVGQFGTQAILPSQSNYDWLRDILQPYGEIETGNIFDIIESELAPSWLRKVATGIAGQAGTPQGERSYLSVFGSMFAHLGSTGEYDVNNEDPRVAADEWTRLVQEAKAKASETMLNLGIAQNILPSTPYIDWEIETPTGDMIRISALSKLLSEKYEAGGENVIGEFLDEYGPWALMAVQGRAINVLPGRIPPTAEADAWFRDNPEFAAAYPTVAHLFAPQEGEFDINAYSNILDRDTSVTLTEEQRVTRFLDTMGQQAYMRELEATERRAAEQYPNYEPGKTLPAAWRKYMAEYDEYLVGIWSFSDGGYAGRGADPAGLPERTVIKDRGSAAVVQLRRAVEDPSVAFDPIAVATREMFDAFDTADGIFDDRYADSVQAITWETSVSTSAIREYIVDYADYLVQRTPEFRTIYEEMFLPMIDAGLAKDELGEEG